MGEGHSANAEIPSGTVTFLFSDVEGSTALLERHPKEAGHALARHHALFEELVPDHNGVIFETVGDAVYAVFPRAFEAVACALAVQFALGREEWGSIGRFVCRLALHTGDVERRGDHYFGPALFRCARLQAIGHGQQTLVSALTAGIVADALPEGAGLRDEGFHRLKDLAEPEHVFMLTHPELRDTFPPLKSLDAHPNNLPILMSSFVDRQEEIVSLSHLLTRGRLLTITGPGGMGKTRLALKLAAEQTDYFADGVFFVDLSGVTSPELVLPTIAMTLGVREPPGPTLEAALIGYLAMRKTLLVLDSVEQVIEAAPDVGRLLTAAPSLTVVATSRMSLRIGGEQQFELGPLRVAASSDDTGTQAAPGVQLFLERAREVDSNFMPERGEQNAVVSICRRLDGMPLAIELAAARTRLFTPSALEGQLASTFASLGGERRDAPSRQRTLAAAISWSLSGLQTEVAGLFAALAVFAGGFTIPSAAQVIGESEDVIVSALDELLDRSLIRRMQAGDGEPRFGMYAPVRDFARRQVGPDAEQIAERHAEFYASLAMSLEAPIRSGEPEALAKVVAELDNFRSALAHDLATLNGERAARLASALWEHWALGAFTPVICETGAPVAQRLPMPLGSG